MKTRLTFLLSVAAAAIFAGCSVNEIESDALYTTRELTFEASVSESNGSPASDTKTSATLNDDGSFAYVSWNPNDQINLFFTAGSNVTSGCFTNKAETDTKLASFSGTIDVFTGTCESPVDEQMFWAFYPYSENNTCNGSAITFEIPAEQSSPAGTFAKGQWPMMAHASGFNLAFYAVCSGIKFKVLGEGVTSVTFRNMDGGAINGTVSAGWDSSKGIPEMSGIEGGSDQVVVTPQGSSTFEVGKIYFAVIPTVTMSQGIEVTYSTARSSCTYVNEKSLAFSRNVFKNLYDKDTEYEDAPVAVYTKVDEILSEGGSYIIVNNGMALRDNGGSMDKVDVSSALSSDKSTLNVAGLGVNDIESLVWNISSSDLYTSYGAYTVMNGSDYLYVSGSYNSGYTLSLGTSYSQAKYAVWNYSGNRIVNGGGSTKRYLSYGSAWTVLTSSDNAGDTYLYKYEGTYTPPTEPVHKDPYYVKVSDGIIEDGTYLIVYETEKYAFNATNTTNYWIAVEPADGKIAATDDLAVAEVEITAKNGKYFFKTNAGYAYCNSNALAFNSSMDDKCLNSSTTASDGCFKFQNGSNNYYLRYSASNKKFQYGSWDSANTLALYVLEGSTKTSRRLAFSEASVTKFTGDASFTVSLSGITSDVVFSSSDTAVATVNASTGEVTIAGKGTTTITASAPETDSYRAGTASFTLTVKEEGAWNLENSYYGQYLDAATASYKDTDWSSNTIVEQYCSNSASNRKDVPAPVTVSWTATSGSGSYTVTVYNDAEHASQEMSQTSTSTSANIYNLIPNRTYYYTVTRGSSAVSSGTFKTEGRRRMMKVSDTYAIGHANNCRDFGGLKTVHNKTIKYNKIFRGSNMDKTTDAEKQYLTGYMNLGLDVDLRNGTASSAGSSESGNNSAYEPFRNAGYSNVAYVKGGFTGNVSSDFPTTNKTTCTTMTNIFGSILSTIRSGKAAYIHCYVGADRTGYVCILLEAVLGVAPKDCSIDYETTSFSVVGKRTRSGGGNRSGIDSYNLINGYSKGSTFEEKAYNILRDYGVKAEDIEEFRALMLE